MRLAVAFCVAVALCSLPAITHAQPFTSTPPLDVGTTEWMVTSGPAFSVNLFHSVAGHRYFLQTVSWGRVLTGEHGPGKVRGRFQWSFEIVPLYGQYHPDNTLGVGISPLLWRWNFAPSGKVAPFVELAGGALFTRDPVPAKTTRANFTAHVAYGMRYFLAPQTALVVGYRFHHISNGNRLQENPAINAHVVQFGLSMLRSR
jgi:Lipid A 3-O-deacylase (PagL)